MTGPEEATMTLSEFLAWQWSDYPAKHRHRLNLLIHVVAVPLFLLGCVVVVLGIASLTPMRLGVGLLAMVASVALEGVGHRLEPEHPAPFDGPADFLRRFFTEQWVTFPRFVLSGRFFHHLAGRSGK
jgi:2-hydroxy-palmitic acid dioxygenase Mpo1-like protein